MPSVLPTSVVQLTVARFPLSSLTSVAFLRTFCFSLTQIRRTVSLDFSLLLLLVLYIFFVCCFCFCGQIYRLLFIIVSQALFLRRRRETASSEAPCNSAIATLPQKVAW